MRLFSLKILIYSAILIVLILIPVWYLSNDYIKKLNGEDIHTVIIGDSHTEFIRGEGILNLSQSGSPYYIWLPILNKIDFSFC